MEDEGGWQRLKTAIGSVVRALSALAATRWTMAALELRAFGKRLAVASFLFAAAGGLVAASGLLAGAAIVVALHALVGSWLAAVLLAFGLCLLGAAAFVAIAVARLRRGGRLFAETARELRRDLDGLAGPQE
jgi:hypothetical protein